MYSDDRHSLKNHETLRISMRFLKPSVVSLVLTISFCLKVNKAMFSIKTKDTVVRQKMFLCLVHIHKQPPPSTAFKVWTDLCHIIIIKKVFCCQALTNETNVKTGVIPKQTCHTFYFNMNQRINLLRRQLHFCQAVLV